MALTANAIKPTADVSVINAGVENSVIKKILAVMLLAAITEPVKMELVSVMIVTLVACARPKIFVATKIAQAMVHVSLMEHATVIHATLVSIVKLKTNAAVSIAAIMAHAIQPTVNVFVVVAGVEIIAKLKTCVATTIAMVTVLVTH